MKAIVASAFNALALVTSFQEHFEWWLRCASLVAGTVVAVLTAISIVRKWRADR